MVGANGLRLPAQGLLAVGGSDLAGALRAQLPVDGGDAFQAVPVAKASCEGVGDDAWGHLQGRGGVTTLEATSGVGSARSGLHATITSVPRAPTGHVCTPQSRGHGNAGHWVREGGRGPAPREHRADKVVGAVRSPAAQRGCGQSPTEEGRQIPDIGKGPLKEEDLTVVLTGVMMMADLNMHFSSVSDDQDVKGARSQAQPSPRAVLRP